MWSFPGSYANRGSGTQQASSDVGTSVHNGLNQNGIIPAAGTYIPNIFIGTFDFLKALLYNGYKGGRMI